MATATHAPVQEACPFCGQPKSWGHTCAEVSSGKAIHEHSLDYDATSGGRLGWCRTCLKYIRIIEQKALRVGQRVHVHFNIDSGQAVLPGTERSVRKLCRVIGFRMKRRVCVAVWNPSGERYGKEILIGRACIEVIW